MGQSPSKVNSRSAGQEILRLLSNTKVHCRVPTSPPLDHTSCQTSPVLIRNQLTNNGDRQCFPMYSRS